MQNIRISIHLSGVLQRRDKASFFRFPCIFLQNAINHQTPDPKGDHIDQLLPSAPRFLMDQLHVFFVKQLLDCGYRLLPFQSLLLILISGNKGKYIDTHAPMDVIVAIRSGHTGRSVYSDLCPKEWEFAVGPDILNKVLVRMLPFQHVHQSEIIVPWDGDVNIVIPGDKTIMADRA